MTEQEFKEHLRGLDKQIQRLKQHKQILIGEYGQSLELPKEGEIVKHEGKYYKIKRRTFMLGFDEEIKVHYTAALSTKKGTVTDATKTKTFYHFELEI